ncbi:MAG: zinc ribbon domain-containing protein [Mogibacterium sp.]|nr:zinc ribbon domain-containing protein [Mogibacterium sp.]
MISSNYLIINKKAQKFGDIKFAGHTLVFIDGEGKPLNYGVLALDDAIYAIMCCDDYHALALVTDKDGRRSVEIIMWQDAEAYAAGKARIAEITHRRIYIQDYKFSSYAWLVAKKLDEGNRVKLVDAIDESKMAACPECGMLNPAGSPYCLDCGAEMQ